MKIPQEKSSNSDLEINLTVTIFNLTIGTYILGRVQKPASFVLSVQVVSMVD